MHAAHRAARARVTERFQVAEVSWRPFAQAGDLLYQGPWVAERLAEFGDFVADRPDAVLPVIRQILAGGAQYSAVDVFAAMHRLGELQVEVARVWQSVDVMVVPVLGTTFTTS